METNLSSNPNQQQAGRLVSTYSNDPEIHDLVVQFVGEMPQKIHFANEAFMGGDRTRLQIWAHQMKGGAGGYGFLEISNKAADLENALTTNQTTEKVFLALLIVINLCERASAN